MSEIQLCKAVVFDLDGTLVDTELINSEAFGTVLGQHGVPETELTIHGTIHIPGETTQETWERLLKLHSLPLSIAELTDHKRAAALTLVQDSLVPLPGVIDLLDELEGHAIPTAVASAAQSERLVPTIQALGLTDRFKTLVSANDVERIKPAPDAYLLAAKRLGVLPASCIAIEDTELGIAAAKDAGMIAVAVPNDYTKAMDFGRADLVVRSLEELSGTRLGKIMLPAREA